MSNWILWEEGAARLRTAGYLVSHDRGVMFVRIKYFEHPDKLNIKNGRVSEKTVTTLINRIKRRG